MFKKTQPPQFLRDRVLVILCNEMGSNSKKSTVSNRFGTSLVVQWLGICLTVQWTWV